MLHSLVIARYYFLYYVFFPNDVEFWLGFTWMVWFAHPKYFCGLRGELLRFATGLILNINIIHSRLIDSCESVGFHD